MYSLLDYFYRGRVKREQSTPLDLLLPLNDVVDNCWKPGLATNYFDSRN